MNGLRKGIASNGTTFALNLMRSPVSASSGSLVNVKGSWSMKSSTAEAIRRQASPGSSHSLVNEDSTIWQRPLADRRVMVAGEATAVNRRIAFAFARAGADVWIASPPATSAEMARPIRDEVGAALLVVGDLLDGTFCRQAVEIGVQRFGGIDILVNLASNSGSPDSQGRMSWDGSLRRDLRSFFEMTQAALPYISPGGCILNGDSVASETADPGGIDGAISRGAIIAFSHSLQRSLSHTGIRVRCVSSEQASDGLVLPSGNAKVAMHCAAIEAFAFAFVKCAIAEMDRMDSPATFGMMAS